ncbi:MAG: phage terminase large subunit family protein [Planctomycetes bacterium]|nr:phage terminase large subunit family protein [Planctomycetota bacterium]
MPGTVIRHGRQAYQKARERAKARSAAITMAGQDIAPIPMPANQVRRANADRDLKFFCETYFSHLFTLAWSQDHLRVIAKIERVVRYRETLAVAMPRGSGKTTLCLVAVLWAVLSGRHEFVFLIANAQEAALAMLANIKSHILGNDLLLADYPEAVWPIRCLEGEARRCTGQRYYGIPTRVGWGADEIVMPTIPGSRCSGSIIRVSGITGNIRGALHVRADGSQIRPTLVVCDDPQTDQSAHSLLQTAERLSIINGAVKGLAGPGQRTAIIIPCTVIQGGDLADQLLDRQKNPSWHGERTRLVYSFPTNERLWSEYARIRDESLRADGDGREATEFYAAHRQEMDTGVVVAWPQRYLASRGEISAIQHAMNLKLENERAFYAEYQNEPLKPSQLPSESLTVQMVCEKANGRTRREVPLSCNRLTMFVDVHNKLLYYCLCAWQEDFTGFIVDYGTYPEQTERTFAMDGARRTLGRTFPGAGPDGAIQAGLEKLVSKYLDTDFRRGSGLMRIDRLLVDMGYKPGTVAAVRHKVGGSAMMLCKGLGIRAGSRPMSGYARRVGQTLGHYWYIPNVSRTAEFPHVASDVNYWKTFLHGALAAPAGDPGSMTIFGQAGEHELFARHIAASETWTATQGHGRTVLEWTPLPGRPDNHWLDCLVGCAVAASMLGVRLQGQAAPNRRRKRYTQEDFSRR